MEVLVMNDVVVVALISAFELGSRNFETHVVHVGKQATERAESCAAAADDRMFHLMQNFVAVALADPL